jgi:ABC-type xylose transport system substrate-binding protein
VNIIPNAIVIVNAIIACRRLAAKKARCAQVILTPDDNNIKVFKKGNSKGFNTSIPFGGQTQPIETAGDRLEWKNAQKNPTKNIISETINKITP